MQQLGRLAGADLRSETFALSSNPVSRLDEVHGRPITRRFVDATGSPRPSPFSANHRISKHLAVESGLQRQTAEMTLSGAQFAVSQPSIYENAPLSRGNVATIPIAQRMVPRTGDLLVEQTRLELMTRKQEVRSRQRPRANFVRGGVTATPAAPPAILPARRPR